MRMHVLVFLILVASASACASNGPIRVTQNFWTGGTPVKLMNATDRFVKAEIGTFDVDVPAGQERVKVIDPGLIIFNYPTVQLTVTARVCERTKIVSAVVPPLWATSTANLGNLAITEAYLVSNPGEKDLHERVRQIKAFLDGHGNLGRKAAERDLDEWFHRIEKFGYATLTLCDGRSVVASGLPIPITNNPYYQQVLTIYIRGDVTHGYTVSSY